MEDHPSADIGLEHLCCQNKRCVTHGSRGAGNLSVCGRIGKDKNIRLIYCKTCKTRFSERKGTVFYRSHLPPQTVVACLQHVHEGCGMRATGRLLGMKEDTVIRYTRLAGDHASRLHQELVAFSPSDPRVAVG
jgi:hypothetical protein